MKIKITIAFIIASFLIIAIASPVKAVKSNGTLMTDIMAKGDDLDITGATNFIMAKIIDNKAHVEFQSKIYNDLGEKIYEMKGKLKNGLLLTTEFYFPCPLFNVWWINVWYIEGEGELKTTDTDIQIFFRNSFIITFPNTEGKYKSANIVMLFSPKAEYYEFEFDSEGNLLPPPINEEPKIWEQGGWVIVGAIWYVPELGAEIGPIGPASYLTKYMEK